MSPSKSPVATFGYFFHATVFCSHFLSRGLNQQGASLMYRDPRWSDISWNIKQAHKWEKEMIITHGQNAALPAKSQILCLSFFSYKRFHAVCDLCADKEYDHQGKIVKARGLYVPTRLLMMYLSTNLKINQFRKGATFPISKWIIKIL